MPLSQDSTQNYIEAIYTYTFINSATGFKFET